MKSIRINHVQKGFTLIELMIVVAIIGILAAIAIPQYQDYIARSQVTRVVGEVSALKSGVEETILTGGQVGMTDDATTTPRTVAIGFTGSDLIAGTGSTELSISNPSAVNISWAATLGDNAAAAVKGAIVTITRSSNGSYSCTITAGTAANGWKDSYAPAGCPVS